MTGKENLSGKEKGLMSLIQKKYKKLESILTVACACFVN